MPSDPTLAVSGLACSRGDRELFNGVSFALNAGDVMQVHGANGSGKTTLLRILAGLSQADRGEVSWCGQSVGDQPAAFRQQLRYLGHLSAIKLELSPLENLRIAAGLRGGPVAMDLNAALDRVALYGFEHEAARTLSAGQRRRIGLASLLVSPGKLWLLDEPHTSLDQAGMQLLRSILHEQLAQGGIIILASHTPLGLQETHVHSLQLLN